MVFHQLNQKQRTFFTRQVNDQQVVYLPRRPRCEKAHFFSFLAIS